MPDLAPTATSDVASSHPDRDGAPNPDLPESSFTDTDPTTDEAPTSGPPPNTRRCFVCLVDEPEATLPADWSTPCSCSLEGHQECLLAWVTDLEAQAKDIACPVCKSPILITERYDPAIQLSNFLNHKLSRWSPRILLGFIASGALVSSSVYGVKAISWFAGPEAAISFLLTESKATIGSKIMRRPLHDQTVNLVHLGILPLIAPALVINRMDIGDIITLPASLVYATLFNHSAEFFQWPPSSDRIIAVYPALKATYFHIHRALSDSLERSWAARARALNTDHGAQATHQVAPPPEPAPAMNILDLEIDIQIGEADDDGPQNNGGAPRNRVDVGGRSPINFIAGALLYPGVCYGVGELMRHILPSRLVTKPSSGPPTGLLQERWGRSFIGGCLFVVLKDAFFLYVKYKKMMNRPYRRIKNSDRRNVHNG
ncbi:hypothetical protein RRF57_010483 [Xylaria bambusicola]|uniref:RING-CH-type domain-containing protein n=1 Tax=Xylaria bambusicola TaxID=326684 RepID=A0AAN7ULB6_9PEZI